MEAMEAVMSNVEAGGEGEVEWAAPMARTEVTVDEAADGKGELWRLTAEVKVEAAKAGAPSRPIAQTLLLVSTVYRVIY